jgi:hypothetical protein
MTVSDKNGNEKNDQTSHAPIVGKQSRQAGTAQNDTATRHVARAPTDNGADKWHKPNEALTLPMANATEPVVVPCEWCQRPFTPVRVWGRFCRNSCRVMAHYAKKGSKQGS